MNTFDPSVWTKIETGKYQLNTSGQLRLNCDQSAVVWVKVGDSEAIAAVGNTCNLKVSVGSEFKVVSKGSCYVLDRAKTLLPLPQDAQIYTNVDRAPHESGNYDEVTRALRLMQMKQKQFMDEIRSTRNYTEAVEEIETRPDEISESVEELSDPSRDGDSSTEDESLASES